MSKGTGGSPPIEDEQAFFGPGMLDHLQNQRNSNNSSEAGSPENGRLSGDQIKAADNQPSTSEVVPFNGRDTPGPLPTSLNQKKNFCCPGKFVWLWFLGLQLPSFAIDGEPNLPLELLQVLIGKIRPEDGEELDKLMKQNSVFTRMCTSEQHTKLRSKCKEKAELKDLDLVNRFSALTLVGRTDIELIIGQKRIESWSTKCEHDKWDETYRVAIVHLNFADYDDDWLESEDLEEDPYAAGVHGYWYKNRPNMRCIICVTCDRRFTPNDWVAHNCGSSSNIKRDLSNMRHIGLNTNNWANMIIIKDSKDKESMEAWKKFTMNSHRIGKRAYDDAEPQAPKRVALPKDSIDDEELNTEINEEESTEDMEYEEELDGPGPSGLQQKNDHVVLRLFNKMSHESKIALLHKNDADFALWVKEKEFEKKVLIQNENWQKIRQHPKFFCKATAHFDADKGQFVNMYFFNHAPKPTKIEIQKLSEEFDKLYKEKDLSVWDRMIKEQSLLQNVSSDALRVLNNIPPPPPQIAKPKAVAPPVSTPVVTPVTPIQPTPISFANIWTQLAQQLLANGAKLQIPQVPLPQIPVSQVSPVAPSPVAIAATPSAPTTPVVPVTPVLPSLFPPVIMPSPLAPVLPSVFPSALPVLPFMQNPEFLKAQLQLALTNPTLLQLMNPTMPIKGPTFEQISKILKTTTVKN